MEAFVLMALRHLVPGFSAASFNMYDMYDAEDAERLHARLSEFRKDRVAIGVFGLSFVCSEVGEAGAKTEDGLLIRAFEFTGWKEGDKGIHRGPPTGCSRRAARAAPD